jgi:hypothetical protein
VAETLPEILLDPARRPAVVTDLEQLVDEEVAEKGGISGSVIKTGYAAVKKLKPGVVPFYADYRAAAGSDFGAYLAGRPEAADALLGVTDARAGRTSSDGLRKAYGKLRPHGQRNVAEALPRLGRLIDRHAAA